MSKVYEYARSGKTIVCVDISGMNLKQKDDYVRLIDEAKMHIRTKPPKSALIVTNVTGTTFDMSMVGIIKEYSEHNTPFVKASAVVGISGMQKVILNAVKAVTKREYYLASSMEDAEAWLVNQ